MARRSKQKEPIRRLVYEGPVGLCPCCNKATEVRLAATLGEPSEDQWIVPEDVLEHLYREVARRVQEKGGKLYVTDPSEYDATRRSKLFFVDGSGGIAGPFGQNGLKVFLGTYFGEDSTDNVRVYVVTTTHRALGLIRASPYAREPEEARDLDDPADLF